MIDLMRDVTDEPISLAKAASELPGKPHPATMWRWTRRGLRGQKLETVVVGGRRYTTRQAVARFVEALTRAREAESPAAEAIAAITNEGTVDKDLAGRAADAARQLKQLGPRAK